MSSNMPSSEVVSSRSIPTLLPRTSSSRRVRTKFLERVGILNPIHKAPKRSVSERSVRDLCNVPRFEEPLRYSHDHIEEKERREPRKLDRKKKKRVNFREAVTVVPIPMRCEYSDRIRNKLWSNRLELRENTERNLIEFAAEHHDWRSVCQEEEMFQCRDKLVHPIHVELGEYTFGTGGRLDVLQ